MSYFLGRKERQSSIASIAHSAQKITTEANTIPPAISNMAPQLYHQETHSCPHM